MSSVPRSLLSRRVRWQELTHAHDNKTLFHKETTGTVIETHWVDATLYCVIATPDGRLYTKSTNNIFLVNTDAKTTT